MNAAVFDCEGRVDQGSRSASTDVIDPSALPNDNPLEDAEAKGLVEGAKRFPPWGGVTGPSALPNESVSVDGPNDRLPNAL